MPKTVNQRGNCSNFYRKTKQMHNISNLFYFGTTL